MSSALSIQFLAYDIFTAYGHFFLGIHTCIYVIKLTFLIGVSKKQVTRAFDTQTRRTTEI